MAANSLNVVTARQIKAAQQFEDTVDRGTDALVNTLKQACSRNRAIEKQDLWKERHEQDHGSKTVVSLKSKDGEVHTTIKVPAGADVTQNGINKYAEDRVKNAAQKEDLQLRRFCDGQDTAWRPDSFFVEECGEEDLPPWPMRPTELYTNPHLSCKIMAEQMARQKLLRKAKKMAKKELKAEKKVPKQEKKDKKLKKEVKKAKKKLKKAVRKERKEARREKEEGKTSKKHRKVACSPEHEEDEEEEQAAVEMEGEDSDDDEVEDGVEAASGADGEGDEVVSVHLSVSEAGASSNGDPS